MTKALWIPILAAFPLLAQQQTPQQPPAANQPFQLPSLELNFKNIPLPARRAVSFLTTHPPASPQTRVCAIPLLKIVPPGNYPMLVIQPKEVEANAPHVNPPAPACDEAQR